MKEKNELSTAMLLSRFHALEKFWETASRRGMRRGAEEKSSPGCPRKRDASPTLGCMKERSGGGELPSVSFGNSNRRSPGIRDGRKRSPALPPSSKPVASLRHAVIASRQQQEKCAPPYPGQRATSSPGGKRSPSHRNGPVLLPPKKAVLSVVSSDTNSSSNPSSPSTPPSMQGRCIKGTSRGPRIRGQHERSPSKSRAPPEKWEKQGRRIAEIGMDRRERNLKMKNGDAPIQVARRMSDIPMVQRTQVYSTPPGNKQIKNEDYPKKMIRYSNAEQDYPLSPSPQYKKARPKPFKVCNAEELDVLIVTPVSKTIVSSSGSWNSLGPSGNQEGNPISSSSMDVPTADSLNGASAAATPLRSPHTPLDSVASSFEDHGSGSPVSSPFHRRNTDSLSYGLMKRRRNHQPEQAEERGWKENGKRRNPYDTERAEVACRQCGARGLPLSSKFCSNCGRPLT